MFITKKNKKKIIIFSVVLLFLITTDFFINFYNLIRFNYDQRIVNAYGFCSRESIGYLNYIKAKYKFSHNIRVINYIHTPNVSWSITNPRKINEYSNELILLNYPGHEIKIKLNQNKINEYTINNFYFYLDKIKKYNYLEINSVKTTDLSNPKIEIIIQDSMGNIIKNMQITNFKIFENRIIYSTNIHFEELKNSFNLYFRLSGINIKNSDQIFFNTENKYNISNYKIMDNYDTCYYLKNR